MTGVLSHASGFSNQSSIIMLTQKKNCAVLKGMHTIIRLSTDKIHVNRAVLIHISLIFMHGMCVHEGNPTTDLVFNQSFYSEGANDYSKCRQCVLTFSSFLLHAILPHFCRISWWAVDVFPRNTASEYSPFRILVSVCVCVFVYSLLPITTAATKLQCI